ncbi:MAG TPA: type II secretion system protein GspD, partial [Desulfobacterales bacterium]|nr:type II secretion system protein GspD [Desulfobacterales bacterium]
MAVLAAVLAILAAGGLFSPGGRAAAAPTAASPADGRLAIDFNNVDIRVFIKYISQLTGKNFVVDKDVKGAITVISATPVSAADAYRVF